MNEKGALNVRSVTIRPRNSIPIGRKSRDRARALEIQLPLVAHCNLRLDKQMLIGRGTTTANCQ